MPPGVSRYREHYPLPGPRTPARRPESLNSFPTPGQRKPAQVFFDTTAGYATQWWKDAGSAARATVVTIRADTVSAGIDAALAR